MKDIMQKLAELEATAPKATSKKLLTEDSTTPPTNVSNKPASLKDVFETMATKQSIPVVGKEGGTQTTGAGFINVTDNSPAAQALGKAVGDLAAQKKLQIVVPNAGQQGGQPAAAGATGQAPVGATAVQEKWGTDTKVAPSEKGKYAGKDKAELTKAYNKLKASGPHKKGSPEFGKMRELAFAIRAKSDWGKVQEGDEEGQAHGIAGQLVSGAISTIGDMAGDVVDNVVGDVLGEGRLDELSPETIKAAQAKRYGQLNQLAQTGAARAGSTTSFNAKASPQTINQFHDTETKAINRDFNDQQRTSAKYDPAERDAALASNERTRARNMSRGNMLNVANKKLQGTANVPAKSVAEGAKVDRMVKHIEKSEKKLGKSKEEAQDIAWATANKRGMLDNKNKKKTNEDVDQEIADIRKTINDRKRRIYTPNHPEKKETEQLKRKLDKLVKSKEVKEGDIAPTNGIDTRGAGLGAGRSATTLEGKKPDFLDLDKDGNKKESMKKAAADKKKKKVDESMNHRISAARLEGKSHGLRGHAHSGKRYEDLEEMKAYHEGYKEGLDECYGQGVYETAPAATVPGMASQAIPAMEDEVEEGNAFTAALAKTPKGGKFTVGGKTFTDRSNYGENVNEYAFESLDNQLNALLNESEEVTEGLSVSVSKGQQNSPDSVTITAQDAEADQLLQLVKHAGLGLFGDEHDHEPSSAMSIQPAHGAPDEVGAGGVDVEVVDGNDGIMGLMQKLSGIQSAGADDYADEEGEEQLHGNHSDVGQKDCGCEGDCECDTNEETCNECGGMMEAGHSCGSKMAEDESEDQMEFEVSEDNAPDSDEAETSADEDAEDKEDAALAGEKEEEMNESFASLLDRLTKLAEGSGDKPKHPEHDEKDDKDFDDAEEEVTEDKEKKTFPTSYAKGSEEEKVAHEKDKMVAKALFGKKSKDKEKVDEWANDAGKKGTDASFEQDIDFMTKVISGGLNKPKSTGQTTVPVIAGQTSRMHDHQGTVSDSVDDWVKLAGIK